MLWKRFLGDRGENLAAAYLKKQGFIILKRNYRCKLGEIDIIAKDKNTISFIEVKTVSGGKTETPFDTINSKKRAHIENTAEYYLNSCSVKDLNCRFDVVAIKYNGGKEPDIEFIKDAF